MIYFQTLYFMCDQVTRWKIEDHLGMERHMTVNGEWPVVMGDKGEELLREIERRGYIQIRNKFINTGMKATKGFIETIRCYLEKEAEKDPLFAKKIEEHPEKTPEAVCNYIMAEVSKAGQSGWADEEIYGMAKHFIDEDELQDPGDKANKVSRMVINRHVDLTEEQKQAAMAKAEMDFKKELETKHAKEEAARREKEKAAAEKRKLIAEEKAKKAKEMQLNLFDF